MKVKVRIPLPLQRFTGKDEVECEGSTLKELIDNLDRMYPGIKERLCDEKGELRRFVNIFVNDEDIRFLQGGATPLKEGDVVSIIPAIAGG